MCCEILTKALALVLIIEQPPGTGTRPEIVEKKERMRSNNHSYRWWARERESRGIEDTCSGMRLNPDNPICHLSTSLVRDLLYLVASHIQLKPNYKKFSLTCNSFFHNVQFPMCSKMLKIVLPVFGKCNRLCCNISEPVTWTNGSGRLTLCWVLNSHTIHR